jgi:hypothetical protein
MRLINHPLLEGELFKIFDTKTPTPWGGQVFLRKWGLPIERIIKSV